jgi:hypothetical protein
MLTPVTLTQRDFSLSDTPAAGAEPPGVVVETRVVSEAPFSKLGSLQHSAIKQAPSKFKRDPDTSNQFAGAEYLEAALRLNTQRIETTEHYMRLDNISLLAGGWDLHPDSPEHRPASPIQDLTFTDCSMFEGVAGVSQDDNPCSPFQVECHIQDARLGNAADFHIQDARLGNAADFHIQDARLGNAADFQKTPEPRFFSPAKFCAQSRLPPDIEEYLHIIAKDDGQFVKVSSRPTASGGLVSMYFNLHLTRQMFQNDATVRSTGATRKIFCVTQVELDAQGNETRRLASEKMCCCGTWPLGAGMTHRVHMVHRLRDCSGIAPDIWAQSPDLEG